MSTGTHLVISVSGAQQRNPVLTLIQNTRDANGMTIGSQTIASMDYDGAVELRQELDQAIVQIDKARQAP